VLLLELLVDCHHIGVIDANAGWPSGTVEQPTFELNRNEPRVIGFDFHIHFDEVSRHATSTRNKATADAGRPSKQEPLLV
jgi:hypothetical protein